MHITQRTVSAPQRASVAGIMTAPVQNGNASPQFALELGAGDAAGRLVYVHAVAMGAYPNGRLAVAGATPFESR